MARFVFELESVLTQRQREERDRQLAVAALERRRLELEEFIRGCQRRIEQEREDLRGQLGSGEETVRVDMDGVRVQANAGLHMVARAQRAAIELAGVHRRLETARTTLIEATTGRKAVERLRDRRYEAWLEAQKKAEAAEVDELATMRAGRKDEP